jgi:hypothetical protein
MVKVEKTVALAASWTGFGAKLVEKGDWVERVRFPVKPKVLVRDTLSDPDPPSGIETKKGLTER